MNPREPLLLTFSGSRGWLTRVVITLVGLALGVAAFFFLTVALLIGTCLAAVVAVRWWWVLRRIRSEQAASAALEGEYRVVRDSELRPPVSGNPQSTDRY
jgi:NhaP-type Na+/H+ or K+/H+ antiporter